MGVLAGAAENRFPVSVGASSRQAELSRLITKLRQGLMQKPRFEHPIVLKGNALLHVDLHKLLGNASTLIDAMVELAQSQRWLQTSINIIDFSQCLTQALWIKDHSLAQLPHFGNKEIHHCIKGKSAVKGLREYLDVPDEHKKGLAGICKFDLYVE